VRQSRQDSNGGGFQNVHPVASVRTVRSCVSTSHVRQAYATAKVSGMNIFC
jgi:hypothetical protein